MQKQIAQNGADMDRRSVLKGMAALSGAAFIGLPQSAFAQENVIRAYGVTTAALKDWAPMEESIGLKMEFSPTNADVGVFMRDVIANDIGSTQDILIFDGGTQRLLGPQGFYAEIDENHPKLTNWALTPESGRNSDLVRFEGKLYGIPVTMNADSFGYFPEAIGANPNGEDEISWGKLYADDSTKGRSAVDKSWMAAIQKVSNFLKYHNHVAIEDQTNLTKEEARAVADFMIERKRAGQFRTLFASFEEQVQLLVNKEVDILDCWQPAVNEANRQLGPNTVGWAYTVEGYYIWGHGAHVPQKALERGNVDHIYETLNYLLGGQYRALQVRDRGYPGPNMALAVEYARENDWPQADIDMLIRSEASTQKKFAKPFVGNSLPENADVMEEEWQRFLSA